MAKDSNSGCFISLLIFGILAYLGHPTWWLRGSHDGLGLVIILPAYYSILGLAAFVISLGLDFALTQSRENSATTSKPTVDDEL